MNIVKLLVSVVFCFLAGFIGQIFTMPSIPTWYAALNKPIFNPPNWIFGPVWSTLYLMMAIALYIIWQTKPDKKAISIFALQLVLNSLWSILFFGLHQPLWALIGIICLWLAILFSILSFNKTSRLAAWLLVPYILWVSFAAVLNLFIVILN